MLLTTFSLMSTWPSTTEIEPKLTPRGDLREVTAGFIGGFSP
jgi:hypothetical protein